LTKHVTHINENASVTLKPWNKNDAAALANIADNKKILMQVRDSFPQPYTLTDASKWIDAHLQTSKATNFAIWYNNELAGSIGYVPQENERRNIAEIG
jgi:RimJ/RimL family protein N-acetyltransferase